MKVTQVHTFIDFSQILHNTWIKLFFFFTGIPKYQIDLPGPSLLLRAEVYISHWVIVFVFQGKKMKRIRILGGVH